MSVKAFEEKPSTAALRIFGATALLLGAMLAFLHPQAMMAVVHGMMGAMS